MYDNQIGRWHVTDPLSEKYLAISLYAYVANNPINGIDPNGMEIVEGRDIYEQFLKQSWDNLLSSISTLSSKDKALENETRKGKQTRLKNQIANLKANIQEYKDGIYELRAMDKSEQKYNIRLYQSDVGENNHGKTSFNVNDGTVNMHLKEGYDAGYLAHELKHGFQFQDGQMSYNDSGSGGPLHDLNDEREAFTRGAAFGDKRSISYALDKYKLPKGPY